MPLLTTPLGLPLRLTDDWQMIALGEQHYRACEFGVKTVVLLVRSKCVRQTELVECGLNSLVRQQYRYEFLWEWCRQFPLKLALQYRYKRVVLGKVQALIYKTSLATLSASGCIKPCATASQ